MKRLRIFTWHVHGAYLYCFTQNPHHDFYMPYRESGGVGYTGRRGHIPWPGNLHEIPVEEVKRQEFDCILFQLPQQYLEEQYGLLSDLQRLLPRIYLEHDPPQHPTDTPHWVDDPDVLLVHVTAFNNLMWNSGRTPTRVIDHGVTIPNNIRYLGNVNRGIVVINHIVPRGRGLGKDLYEKAQKEIPMDLIGMQSREIAGGIGEVLHHCLPFFILQYRFFFNPIRYTSLGLAVCKAMMVGLPVVGFATTEMSEFRIFFF